MSVMRNILHVIRHIDFRTPGSWREPRLHIKTMFPRHGIPMLKIRRSWDRLIYNMGIPILQRWHHHIETTPRAPFNIQKDVLSGDLMGLRSREIGSLNYRCRCACQISERSDNSKYRSRDFECLRDLKIRRLVGYLIRETVHENARKLNESNWW